MRTIPPALRSKPRQPTSVAGDNIPFVALAQAISEPFQGARDRFRCDRVDEGRDESARFCDSGLEIRTPSVDDALAWKEAAQPLLGGKASTKHMLEIVNRAVVESIDIVRGNSGDETHGNLHETAICAQAAV